MPSMFHIILSFNIFWTLKPICLTQDPLIVAFCFRLFHHTVCLFLRLSANINLVCYLWSVPSRVFIIIQYLRFLCQALSDNKIGDNFVTLTLTNLRWRRLGHCVSQTRLVLNIKVIVSSTAAMSWDLLPLSLSACNSIIGNNFKKR